jgi:hypothetical protein
MAETDNAKLILIGSRKRNYLRSHGLDGKKTLKLMVKKECAKVMTGFNWLSDRSL